MKFFFSNETIDFVDDAGNELLGRGNELYHTTDRSGGFSIYLPRQRMAG